MTALNGFQKSPFLEGCARADIHARLVKAGKVRTAAIGSPKCCVLLATSAKGRS